MFAMHGFSLITFAALAGGILIHVGKHFRTAKQAGSALTTRQYFVDNWDTTVASLAGSLVLWAGLPELAQKFPEVAGAIGVDMGVGIVSSFGCGIVGNSLADFIGRRAAAVSGK